MAAQRPTFDPDRMTVHEKASLTSRTLTVSQLNAVIKQVLGDHLPGTIHLVGEISNFTRATSGHLYLTLKDDRGEIRAVMWRSSAATLKFTPADGLEVISTGHVDVYEPRGQYQFYIRRLEPRGVGSLELAFRQLHDRLAREGLFEPAHKKPIPPYPRRIAVVTSPTGAAVRDILKTLHRRFPCVSVLLYPVRVQGEGAATEIAEAVRRLNRQADALGGLDLMIVGRGGGSLEDLWAFNEETVARAIHASKVPVISAVGHEVDVTISDLVADLRAPTPTAAAELAVPVLEDLLETLSAQAGRLRRGARHRLDLARSRLDAAARFEWFRDPLTPVRRREQCLDEVCSRLRLSWSELLARTLRRLGEIEVVLATIQPRAFLQQQRNRLIEAKHRLRWAMGQRARQAERQAERTCRALLVASPRVPLQAGQQRVRQLSRVLSQVARHRLRLARQTLYALEARLETTSHRRTLARGFTITRTRQDRRIITGADQVTPGDQLVTETARGAFESCVTEPEEHA